jgi:hypothetical protein
MSGKEFVNTGGLIEVTRQLLDVFNRPERRSSYAVSQLLLR